MDNHLDESDFSELWEWMDGEFQPHRAAEIEQLVREDPSWTDAWETAKALESVLDTWSAPEPSDDLPARIIRNVQEAASPLRRATHLVRWLAPAAGVAAAIVLGAALLFPVDRSRFGLSDRPMASATSPGIVAEVLKDISNQDRFIVENLDFFRNYELCGTIVENESLLDPATLEALDRLENKGI